MLMPDGEVDVVLAFATPLLDASWSMVPFVKVVVPVTRGGGSDPSRMAHYGNACHFMAATPGPKRQIRGTSAVAVGGRMGYHVVPTQAQGDCGIDASLSLAR